MDARARFLWSILVLTSCVLTVPALASNDEQHGKSMQAMSAQGIGVVKAVDPEKKTITLQHEAIPSMGWPAMTMPFQVATPDLLAAAKVGDKVEFKCSGMTLTAIKPVTQSN